MIARYQARLCHAAIIAAYHDEILEQISSGCDALTDQRYARGLRRRLVRAEIHAMKSLFAKTTRFRGLLVLVLWQAAPVGVDEYGRTRVGFGFGAGRIEYTTLTCEGDVVESQTVGYTIVGANLEHWLSARRILLRGSGGYSWSDTLNLNGPFGALTLSREWQGFGIGGGVAIVPEPNYGSAVTTRGTQIYPSIYLRAGNRDKIHFRTEVFPPLLQTHVVPWTLMVGYNQFGRGKSGALGFGLIGTDNSSGGALAEGFLPVSRNADLGLSGFLSPGREKAQAGMAAQVRVTLK